MYKISLLVILISLAFAQVITNIDQQLQAETELPSKDSQTTQTNNSKPVKDNAPSEAVFEGLAVQKFDHFATDITDCAKSVVNKYNSSEEITFLFESISSTEFLAEMKNGTNDDVRAAVLDAIDPFFEKITGFNHLMVVETMPPEIVEWIKATTIIFQKLIQNAKDLPDNEKTSFISEMNAPGIDQYSRLTKDEERALNARIQDLENQIELQETTREEDEKALNDRINELEQQVEQQEAIKDALREQVGQLNDTNINISNKLNVANTRVQQILADNKILNSTLMIQKEQIQKEFQKEIKRRDVNFDTKYKEQQAEFKIKLAEMNIKLPSSIDDIRQGCDESVSGKGDKNYRGCQTKTKRGFTCQSWTAQFPQIHKTTPATRPYDGLEKNYCRNPGGGKTNWCYTTNPQVRWDYCEPISPLAPISNAIQNVVNGAGKDIHIDWENLHKNNKGSIDDVTRAVRKHKVWENKYYKSSYKSAANYVNKSYNTFKNVFGGW